MVQSLERAFAILDEVAQRPAGVTAIAERVRLPNPPSHAARDARGRGRSRDSFDGVRWRIGPGVTALTAAASPERSLITIARPFLVDLVSELGEDAGLGLPDGNEILYVDQVESDNPVQVRDWTGTRAPMHAVPSGLVLLAEWPEDALAAYLRAELASLTRRTETDPPRLRKRLATPEAGSLGARGVRGRDRLGRGPDPARAARPWRQGTSHGPRIAPRREDGCERGCLGPSTRSRDLRDRPNSSRNWRAPWPLALFLAPTAVGSRRWPR